MLVLLHVISALASIVYSSWLYFYPAAKRFYVSYALAASTLLTGSLLIAAKPTHILQTCLMGLFYLGLVGTAIVAARYKLAASRSKQ